MINYINIKNFAIIENVEMYLHKGLSIITGETGAGKSIIIEAITMALGGRGDKSFVRKGQNKAVIQIAGEDKGNEFILYRELSADGRTMSKINGQLVTLTELAKFAGYLVDVHGQYANQSLLTSENHIGILDSFANKELSCLKAEVAQQYQKYFSVKSGLTQLINFSSQKKEDQEYMRHCIDEIRLINPKINEDEEIKEEIRFLDNQEKIESALERAYSKAAGEVGSAFDAISNANSELRSIADFSENYGKLSQEMSDIYFQLEDIIEKIRNEISKSSSSPTEIDTFIERQNEIENLKRKHGGSIEKVLKY
ncbi:MAG: AAA family ATPase, partial [Anaerovoracaceae bacterium]